MFILTGISYYVTSLGRSRRTAASSDVIVLSDEDTSASVSPSSPVSATHEGSSADVSQIRELLEQEESKLRRLQQLRVIQSPLPAPPAPSEDPLESTRTVPRGGGGKANIVVVPGNQKSSGGIGISSRLQHIVDSIAVDHGTGQGCKGPAGSRASPPSSLPPSSLPPPSGQQQQKQSLGVAQSVSQYLRAKGTGRDIITITDSPSHVSASKPPPLLPTSFTSSVKSSVQESSVSSTSADMQPPSLRLSDPEKEKAIMAAVENSKRYRDYLAKHLLAKRSFQKQIERKVAIAPYPKTFRQVWPVIPVFDSSFVRNYGLEAILQHFDSSLNAGGDRASSTGSKVKPICNQCGCDFASAWQIRKSNSKQLLLCEACDFANLKILQRSKLANQLRELLASVTKEREQFRMENEEARKQVVSAERQLIAAMAQQQERQHHPPPLFSQRKTVAGLSIPNASALTNHVFSATHTSTGKMPSGTTVLVNSSQIVIPSILPSLYTQPREAKEGREQSSRKRSEPGGSGGVGPPGKSVKLDLTLNKLSKALLERKLDEQRQQQQKAAQKEGGAPGADSRRSKRKGTPRHKRHLSASSP